MAISLNIPEDKIGSFVAEEMRRATREAHERKLCEELLRADHETKKDLDRIDHEAKLKK